MVLAERELLQQKAHECVDQDEETTDERKAEDELAEEKEHNPGDDCDMVGGGNGGLVGEQSEHVIEQVQDDITPEKMAPSVRMLQRGASSLLRFLVAVSMRQASTARPVSGEVGSQASRDEARRPAEDGRSAVRGGKERSAKADDGAAVAALPPTRERSMYGTPLKQMQEHVDSLHQVIYRAYNSFIARCTLILKPLGSKTSPL